MHPLANYPGPLSYKLSNWPLIFQCMGGNRHIYHLQDHEKYGPIVRIGPNTLSFNTSTALNTIYGYQKTNVRKSEWYRTLDAGSGALSIVTEIDKQKHMTRRRFTAQAFSTTALKEAEKFVVQNVRRFCDILVPQDKGVWSDKVDASRCCTWLAFDVMGDLAFGKSFECMEKEENRYIPRAITSASQYLYWFAFLPGAQYLGPFINSRFMEILGGEGVRDNVRLVNSALSRLDEKIAYEEATKANGGEARKDMLHYLINAVDPKTGLKLSSEELLADTVLLIAAGADTTATALAGSLFYMLHNPRTLRAATAEVRATFSSADEIRSGDKLDSCKYLDGIMEETLRRAPPLPSHLPREVLPGGITIDGHYIPSGTIVGVPAYSIHHNAAYYPDPWSFQPERWLEDEKAGVAQASVDAARRAFCPFSLGIRGCIGKQLAYMEYKIALAFILWSADIRLADGDTLGQGRHDLEEGRRREDEWQLKDCMGVYREGPTVQFRRAYN